MLIKFTVECFVLKMAHVKQIARVPKYLKKIPTHYSQWEYFFKVRWTCIQCTKHKEVNMNDLDEQM